MEIRTLLKIVVIAFLISSCAQITPFHTARTEGAGNLTISPTLDASIVASSPNNAFGTQTFPGFRAELAYGLWDKFDLITSVKSSGSVKGSLKWQFYGDNYSNLAFAIMPGYEFQTNILNQGINTNVQRLHLPLLFSLSGSDLFEYYGGPSAVLQIADDSDNTLFSGVTAGIEAGRWVRYNIGLGIYLPYSFNGNANGSLYQFGVSARIPLRRRI